MPYVLLALVGVAAAVYAISTSAHKPQLITVLVAASALISVGDWVVFGWFRLFSYHPHLAAVMVTDEAWGQLLAEVGFLPGLLVLLLTRVPESAGLAIFAAVPTAIEFFFDRWGIFAHTGWRLWFTLIGLAVIYWLMSRLWISIRNRALDGGPATWILRYSLVFNIVGYLSLYLRTRHFGVYRFRVLTAFGGNDALGRFITYALVAIPLGYWAASERGTARWIRVSVVAAVLLVFDMVTAAAGIRVFARTWPPLVDAVATGVAIGVAAWLQDVISALDRPRVRI